MNGTPKKGRPGKKQTVRTGPKRRRWRRRDWSGKGGIGQERRWGSTVGNFKRERIANRNKQEDRYILTENFSRSGLS